MSPDRRPVLGRAVSVAVGAAVARAGFAAAGSAVAAGRLGGPARWERTNHRGQPVTLLLGPALAGAGAAGVVVTSGLPARARATAALAGLAAAALGAYDDHAGSAEHRGLRGHLLALRHGRVTTGAVKVAGLAGTGLLAGRLLHRHPLDVLLAAGVVAGTANLVNLLDLRPGRAAKAGLLLAAPALLRPGVPGDLLAGPVGAGIALLGPDLREQGMLGDTGANAFGALLGVAAVADASRAALAGRLAALTALTLASERVSFTRVIEATPPLRALDRWGRRPAAG